MFYIFTAGLLWGTIGLFVKELNLLGASSELTSFLRMFSAFMIMLLAALIKHGRKIIIHDKKTLISCVLLGLVCHGAFNIFYTSSIKINGMSIASVLMYTAPVFTGIASGILFHEKFTLTKIFALIVNIFGCVLTVTGGKIVVENINFYGVIMGLCSGFCYGMAAVFGRLAGEKTDALIVSAYSYFFAVIFLFVFMRPDFEPVFENVNILFVSLIYGIIPTSAAYVVYYIGLKKIKDTSRVPVIASIEVAAAVMIGVIFYGEVMGMMNYAGVLIVFLSIMIMAKSQ